MHPILYWFPEPPGLTQVEFMHPMLYCFEVPESVWICSFVHVELMHPMLYCFDTCFSDAEPLPNPP